MATNEQDELYGKLIEAIDRLMEAYRGFPKYPAIEKIAKRTAYRDVILEIVDELVAQHTKEAVEAERLRTQVLVQLARHDAYADCASKAGSGNVVRGYAKHCATVLSAPQQSTSPDDK